MHILKGLMNFFFRERGNEAYLNISTLSSSMETTLGSCMAGLVAIMPIEVDVMEKSAADGVEMDGEETETGGGEVGATEVVVVEGGGGDTPFVASAGMSMASAGGSGAPSASSSSSSSSSRSGGGGDSSLRGVDCRDDEGPAAVVVGSSPLGSRFPPPSPSSSSSSSRCGISIGASFSSARGLVGGTGDSDELRSSSRELAMRSVSRSGSSTGSVVVVDSSSFLSTRGGWSSGCDNGLTMASDKKSASSQERRSAGFCFKFELVVVVVEERWWSTRIIAPRASVFLGQHESPCGK